MTSAAILLGILVAAVIVWYVRSQKQRGLTQAIAERDSIVRRLQEIESERSAAIASAAQRGVTISREGALKHVEALRQSYLSSGDVESARDIERVIVEFREMHGPEIPEEVAYALAREVESKYGR
jgi:sensor domain CHASE-containing protein